MEARESGGVGGPQLPVEQFSGDRAQRVRLPPLSPQGRFDSGSLTEGAVRREPGSTPGDCRPKRWLRLTRGELRSGRHVR